MNWLLISNDTNMPVTGELIDELPDPIPEGQRAEIAALGYPDTAGWTPIGGVDGRGGFIYAEVPQLISIAMFMLLFTQEERLAIRAARATDPLVDDFWELLLACTSGVSLQHPVVIAGVMHLVEVNLITQARADAILAGIPPA